MSLLTELETLFDFGCYNYAAPDGAENESQRDSILFFLLILPHIVRKNVRRSEIS
jgi:hypothetical protein